MQHRQRGMTLIGILVTGRRGRRAGSTPASAWRPKYLEYMRVASTLEKVRDEFDSNPGSTEFMLRKADRTPLRHRHGRGDHGRTTSRSPRTAAPSPCAPTTTTPCRWPATSRSSSSSTSRSSSTRAERRAPWIRRPAGWSERLGVDVLGSGPAGPGVDASQPRRREQRAPRVPGRRRAFVRRRRDAVPALPGSERRRAFALSREPRERRGAGGHRGAARPRRTPPARRRAR